MPVFRLHRQQQALNKVDWALSLLRGSWGERFEASPRRELEAVFTSLRHCIATSEPPGLATATIRTYMQDDTAPEGRGEPARAGAYVYVDNVPPGMAWARFGRTGKDGSVTLQVPSGPVNIRAVIPEVPAFLSGTAAVCVGYGGTDLAPGASGTISIVIDCGKEPLEDTEVVLVEATHDAISASSGSFTLQFLDDGAKVPVVTLGSVELNQTPGEQGLRLTDHFEISEGAIVAKDPAKLLNRLPSDDLISISVDAGDPAGLRHSAIVWLRVVPSRQPQRR
jgi:hypothetical protein